MEDSCLHEIAVTAIIKKDGRYLITKRSMTKRRFPGIWTVPGGRLELGDYVNLPKDTDNAWYHVLEKVVRREVKEEVGLEVKNVRYLTDLATVYPGGNPSLVISCAAEYASGEVVLEPGEADEFRWVTLEEAKSYQLIDGIYNELLLAEEENKKNVL